MQVGSRFLGGFGGFDLDVFKNLSVNHWELGALMSYAPISISKRLNTFLSLGHNELFEPC